MLGIGKDIGIDLGTASVLVYIRGEGVVINEPSVVAIDKSTNKVCAVGEEAQRMIGRTPGNIVAIRPLRDGVISDYDTTERMIKYFLKKVCNKRMFRPNVVVCVPSGVTVVEERAVIDATIQAGARRAYLIEEPIAAAIGAGVDIAKPCGIMIVDIGGGTTDVAIISLGGIVESRSIKVAGDAYDEAIIRYVRKKYSIMIGERTAEEMKVRIGCVFPKETPNSMEVRGRSLVSGLPQTITVTSSEMLEAVSECSAAIVEAVYSVLEKTPPELIGDISANGFIMTGGGSLISGLDKLLAKETGITANIAEDAVSCVAIGTGKALESIDKLSDTVAAGRYRG